MDSIEIQKQFETKEGQAKLAALFHVYGKDRLRLMCMDMSQHLLS